MSDPGTISIWRLGPEALGAFAALSPERLAVPLGLLSMEEGRRSAAFHAEADRRLYIGVHAALRVVLGRLLGLSPERVELAGEAGAKPALRNVSLSSPLRFNLSHTRGAALIATAGLEVGIDIEQHRSLDDLESLAEAIMSPVERAGWDSLAHASRMDAFYRVWTRKEAYLKAIGLGLFRELRAVTVPVTPGDLAESAWAEDCGEVLPFPDWQLCDLPVWEGFSAALCWQASAPLSGVLPRLEIHDLSVEDLSLPGRFRDCS